jgi:hypothetical protein
MKDALALQLTQQAWIRLEVIINPDLETPIHPTRVIISCDLRLTRKPGTKGTLSA